MRQTLRHFTTMLCAAALLLACTGVQVLAAGPVWGELRAADQPVSVRHRPDPAAPIVRTLKTGDIVRVDFIQPNGWAAVFDVTESERDTKRAMGYVELRQLTPVTQVRPAAMPSPTPAPAPRAATPPPAPAKAEPPKPEPKPQPAAQPAPAPAQQAAPVQAKPAPEPAPAPAPQPVIPPAKAEGKSAPAPELKGEVRQAPSLLSGKAPDGARQDPVRITSDKMVYSQAENAVIFQGNVHGVHADMALWATKVTAYFSDKGKAKAQKPGADKGPDAGPGDFGDKIERIVAEGEVRMVAGKNEGACRTLTYFVAEGVLRMEGNPILREGQNTVRGDIIKFYVRENRSEVLSGAQRRVEAIFYSPKGEKK